MQKRHHDRGVAMNFLELSGVIALVFSVINAIYFMAYWKGKIDTKITALWDVYTHSVVVREQQKVHNPHRIEVPVEWQAKLKGIGKTKSMGELCFKIVRIIGTDQIALAAQSKKVGFGEIVAVAAQEVLIREMGGNGRTRRRRATTHQE